MRVLMILLVDEYVAIAAKILAVEHAYFMP